VFGVADNVQRVSSAAVSACAASSAARSRILMTEEPDKEHGPFLVTDGIRRKWTRDSDTPPL